ncbi:MAG TPA: hypothetical protein VFA63_00005 [Pseudonocardiaceae bacterium]|nr:hypothetical protein [Pseudonocardiaceae bacterium]
MLSFFAASSYLTDLDGKCQQRGISNTKPLEILPGFVPPEGLAALRVEISRIRSRANRRDIQMAESEGTWRRMSTIGGRVVSASSALIPAIYHDPQLLNFLSVLAGEKVSTVPDPNENHVINILHESGDLHGAHIDTYAYAFNIVVEAPPPDTGGGQLEVYFNVKSVAESKKIRPEIFALRPGDAYFLKTDTNLHRVRPITGNRLRIVLNLAYANDETKNLASYSSSQLY